MVFWVEVEPGKCIGCLACTRCNNFICGNDFKAQAVRSDVEEIGWCELATSVPGVRLGLADREDVELSLLKSDTA